MMLKIVTALALRLDRQKDAPKRPLIVTPPCQSEIKRTLRHAVPQSKTVCSRGFTRRAMAHSMQMVNVGFPQRVLYGFEMVDTCGPIRSMTGSRHQSKIYAESNQPDFSQILRDLTSMQTLAIYRRLLVQDQLRDQPQRNKIDGRGREMFFLLRMAFWLGLVLVLLPQDKTPESEKLPQVGASEAVSAATAAVSDMSQFCTRQPAACELGGQAATVLGQRAQDGARKLYHIITDKRAPDHTGSIDGIEQTDASLVAAAPHDTLTPNDLQAEWRGVPTD
jgi:hypothetical protein